MSRHTLHLRAGEARVGDELLVGPQGPVSGNPTITKIVVRHDGALIATLMYDGAREEQAAWLPDSPLYVYRPETTVMFPETAGQEHPPASEEAVQVALGELGEALMKDGTAKDACIERAIALLNGTVRP